MAHTGLHRPNRRAPTSCRRSPPAGRSRRRGWQSLSARKDAHPLAGNRSPRPYFTEAHLLGVRSTQRPCATRFRQIYRKPGSGSTERNFNSCFFSQSFCPPASSAVAGAFRRPAAAGRPGGAMGEGGRTRCQRRGEVSVVGREPASYIWPLGATNVVGRELGNEAAEQGWVLGCGRRGEDPLRLRRRQRAATRVWTPPQRRETPP